MTVKEFYEWAKAHKCEDAEMRGRYSPVNAEYPISEWNIDIVARKEPNKPKEKLVILGG